MRLNQIRWLTLLVMASITPFCGLAAASPQPNVDNKVDIAALALMQEYGIPGLAIAVTEDGQQKFYSYGVASRDTQQKVTSDTLFELGSISKTFTATLATYSQASGQLKLTDHPGKYFPDLQGSKLDEVTLINLGTHTAGGFPLQLPDSVQNDSQLMEYFKAWQPQFAPNTYRSYANPSIGLLGMVAAKSLGTSFEQAVEAQIFAKLGMHSSYINVPASKMALYAQGYNKQDVPVRVNPGMLAAEAYGVKTSVSDMLRFVEANMNVAKTDPLLQRAINDTHIGYFALGSMTQDLVWEQYLYPVRVDILVEGNSGKITSESTAVNAISPPLSAQQNVWINKTGSTNGFGAYVAFIPLKKLGIVILANKNCPNEARVRLAHQILSTLAAAHEREQTE